MKTSLVGEDAADSFYYSIANELFAKLRRLSAFVDHAPSIGSYHEEALKSVLRSMLPARFGIRTGFAYDSVLGPSQQGDILIVDENHPAAYHFKEGEFAVVLPEALVAVVEVKTRLNKQVFNSSIQALHSFRRLSKRANPTSFVFAYESPPFSERTLLSWYRDVPVPHELQNYPWCIFALDQGSLILWRESESVWGHRRILEDATVGPKLKSLSMFLQTLRKSVLTYAGVDTNPFAYAALDGLVGEKVVYRFGP